MPPTAPGHNFSLALDHLRHGRICDAEALLAAIPAPQSVHARAFHLLGMLILQSGRADAALGHLQRAAQLDSQNPAFHAGLGEAYRAQSQLAESAAAFRAALQIKPDFDAVLASLSDVLHRSGQADEALACARRATELRPDSPEYLSNLGYFLECRGQSEQAADCYRRALVRAPNHPVIQVNLGNALLAAGRPDEAVHAYELALKAKPDFALAWYKLAVAHQISDNADAAIAAYRQAIRYEPGNPNSHYNLGILLHARGAYDESIAAYREAIRLHPGDVHAHNNLGNTLKDSGRITEAVAELRKVVELRPDHAAYHGNLILALNYDPASTPETLYQEARLWAERHAAPLAAVARLHSNDRNPERRLRIGYVSADFREHASAQFLLPLFRHHDPAQVEIFYYANVRRPDAMTRRFQELFPSQGAGSPIRGASRDILNLSDDQVVDIIRQDRIDILVDLKLHTDDHRLLVFARKPAPLQVTWLGYPGTTGLDAIDYRLTDPYLDPLPADSVTTTLPAPASPTCLSSEQPLRLPDTFWCYDPLAAEPEVNELPALSTGRITFGCLNSFAKINEQIVRLWATILRHTAASTSAAGPHSDSRLLLLATEGTYRQNVLNIFEQEGISPARVEFVTPRPRRKYLELYHQIDLSLDPWPCNGHTSSLDSLWMGVPVVTRIGPTIMGRAGFSQLMNLQLHELIASTAEQYVEIATALAGDLPRLGALRTTLRPRMETSPLMDAPRFARAIETAYRTLWRHWCSSPSAATQ